MCRQPLLEGLHCGPVKNYQEEGGSYSSLINSLILTTAKKHISGHQKDLLAWSRQFESKFYSKLRNYIIQAYLSD